MWNPFLCTTSFKFETNKNASLWNIYLSRLSKVKNQMKHISRLFTHIKKHQPEQVKKLNYLWNFQRQMHEKHPWIHAKMGKKKKEKDQIAVNKCWKVNLSHNSKHSNNKNVWMRKGSKEHTFQQNDCSPLLTHNEIFPWLHQTQIYKKIIKMY